MRRTFLMVLVQVSLFLMAAAGSPALHAQAETAAPHSRARAYAAVRHTHRHAARHTTTRRTSAHASPCPAPHTAARAVNYPSSRRRHAATQASIATTPSPHPQAASEQADASADTAADPTPEATPQPFARPASLSRRRAVTPPPMRGSLTSLERQNDKAEAEGLERIEDEEDLSDRIARKFLVPVPVSAALAINGNLPEHHRYCRPWTARFLSDLARAHAIQFHGSLQVSSAVRTVEYQKRLIEVNGNAAAAEGDIVSPHLTGATIDIAKSGLTRQEIGWMRAWLIPLQDAGKIDVEEEFQQACFHITVYKTYVPPRQPSSPSRARTAQQKRSQPGARQPIPATTAGIPAQGR